MLDRVEANGKPPPEGELSQPANIAIAKMKSSFNVIVTALIFSISASFSALVE
jgi:hypothetical protein